LYTPHSSTPFSSKVLFLCSPNNNRLLIVAFLH
jgi:hypothetical protein